MFFYRGKLVLLVGITGTRALSEKEIDSIALIIAIESDVI
jgi:hypothetical protein